MKVQTPRLKTSYALSPQSKFTCPPCCIRRKSERSHGAQSHTYCSVVDSKARIQLFSDNSGTERAKPSSVNVAGVGAVCYPIPESSQPIVHIDVVPSSVPLLKGEDLFDVVAVHQDGEIRCLSGDLRMEKWCTSIASLIAVDDPAGASTTTIEVEYSTLIDAETAGKGLLKERADLRAMLGADLSTGSPDIDTTVLFLITRSQEDDSSTAKPKTLHMFALRGDHSTLSTGGFTSKVSSLQHMQSVKLPEHSEPESKSQQSSQLLLHASSGTLYHGSDENLRVYDLSGTVPKLLSYISLDRNDVTCFLRLSSSSIITASSTSLAIQDTNYRSVQAIHPLSNGTASEKASRTGGAKIHPVRLLSYLSQLGLALAMSDRNDLLAFQITLPYSTLGQRKRKRDGLLIDSIGKGLRDSVAPSNLHGTTALLGSSLPSRTVHDTHWLEVMTRLERHVTQKGLDTFEPVMLSELGASEDGQFAASRSQNKKHSKRTHGKSPPGRQTTNDQIAHDSAHSGKVLYVLEKMFQFVDAEDQPRHTVTSGVDAASSLKVVYFPPKLFRWLVESGNISASNVELALRQKDLSIAPNPLTAGALTEALVQYDPSLAAIMFLLEGPVYLDAMELAHLVKLLLNFLAAKERTSGRLLTNGEEEYVNGETEDAPHCGAVVAGDDLDSMHQDSPSVHRQVLIAASRRLYSFPPSTVTKALRKQLNTSDTIQLIHELRIELARGGWTSDPEFSSDLYHHQDQHEALHMLIDLINCAIDSIGMGGWFLGASALDDSEDKADMIESMIAEISAVLQGVQEAAYLTGTLTQMLLYAKSAAAGIRSNPTKGHDTVATAKSVEMPLDTVDTRLLPLSLKAPQNIPLTKVGAGGEIQRRSRRDIGRLKSKMVGKYSRERIVF